VAERKELADFGVLAKVCGRSEMAQEQRPPNMTAHDSTLFTECKVLFNRYFIRMGQEVDFKPAPLQTAQGCGTQNRFTHHFVGHPPGHRYLRLARFIPSL
jgi:hypothetical protein